MFIYVFNEADCDVLSAAGFHFICEYPDGNAWVFLYDAEKESILGKVTFVKTTKMCFPVGKDNTDDGGC